MTRNLPLEAYDHLLGLGGLWNCMTPKERAELQKMTENISHLHGPFVMLLKQLVLCCERDPAPAIEVEP